MPDDNPNQAGSNVERNSAEFWRQQRNLSFWQNPDLETVNRNFAASLLKIRQRCFGPLRTSSSRHDKNQGSIFNVTQELGTKYYLSQADLFKLCRVHDPSISEKTFMRSVLPDLEALGWINRRPAKELPKEVIERHRLDRRATLVELTVDAKARQLDYLICISMLIESTYYRGLTIANVKDDTLANRRIELQRWFDQEILLSDDALYGHFPPKKRQ